MDNTLDMEEYYEWWNNRPPKVLEICKKIIEYEIYFTDMSLNKNGLLKDYLASPEDCIEPLEELLLNNPSLYFKICVHDLDDRAGCVNPQEKILAIDDLSPAS